MDDHQEWGERGVELQSSSTLQVQKKDVPSRANIDDKKIIYYVEEPTSLARITKDTLD
jgi:hypothetical protein